MNATVDHLGHLVRRFAGSLSRRPPDPAAEGAAVSQLSAGEQVLWRRMSLADRRHAIEVWQRARAISALATTDRAVAAGVLLHDVGKIDAGLGTAQRVAATVWSAVRGERAQHGSGRWARYLRHEEIGAAMVRTAGSDPLTVALVARDDSLRDELRSLLERADDI